MSTRKTQFPTESSQQQGACDPHRVYQHPAFATLQVSELSGGSRVLFGSDVDHQYRIAMRVTEARLHRDLSHDWIHSSPRTIVEFEMTHAQFAALAGSVGKGSGVPVTLTYKPISTGLEMVPAIGRVDSKLDVISREVEECAKRRLAQMQSEVDRLGALIEGGKAGIKELRAVHRGLSNAATGLPSSLGYTVNQAKEMLEKAGNDAKAQVEAFAESTLRRAGLEGVVQLPPSDCPRAGEASPTSVGGAS
ncbi:MAG: hypothetical protein KKD97_16000 [Gammaproteobacteria bacterium]|nr:hypothetical protein [Gammaproteobacteria bacterium]